MASRGRKRRTREDDTPSLDPLRSPSLTDVDASLRDLERIRQRYVRDVIDRRRFNPDPWNASLGLRRDSDEVVYSRNFKLDARREAFRKQVEAKRLNEKKLGPFTFKLFDNAPYVSPDVRFRFPRQVAICVRRKIRREVLHALHLRKHGGKGGRQFRKARWNEFSFIRC